MATNCKADPLNCHVCLEPYKDPFLLPCLHSFCKKCLVAERERQGTSEGKLKCPTCNASFNVPPVGIAGFAQDLSLARRVDMASYERKLTSGDNIPCDRCVKRANGYAMVFCCQCCYFLCLSCKEDHEWWRETINHELIKVSEKQEFASTKDVNKLPKVPQKPSVCTEHPDEKLKFYCEECEVLSCRDCLVFGHKDHTIQPYGKVAEQGREEISEGVGKCKEVVGKLEGALLECDEMVLKIKSRRKKADDEVNEAFSALSSVVADRWKALLKESEEIENSKVSVITMQLEEFRRLKSDITYAYQFAENALESSQPLELLASKKLIRNRLHHCIQLFSHRSGELNEDESIHTSIEVASLVESVKVLGSFSYLDVSACCIDKGLAIPFATVGTERKFSLFLRDNKGNPFPSKVSVSATLKNIKNGGEIKMSPLAIDGGVSLSMVPPAEGEHLLCVKVGGREIKPSPYKLWVRQPIDYSKLSTPVYFSIGRKTNDVAVHSSGDVYVSDSGGYICVFDEEGSLKQTIGSPGSGQGQFKNPCGVVIVEDVLFVVDSSNHRVQKITLSGEYIGEFGTNGSGEDQFSSPRGIVHDGKRHVFVADYNNRKIKIFDTNGTFVKQIECGAYSPLDVAIDNDSIVHVLYGNKVQMFSQDGSNLSSYTNGKLQSAQGIAIDDREYRFVTSQYQSGKSTYYYLHVLDTDGNQIRLLSSFNDPRGVTLDKDGHIYIADFANSRIVKF